MQFKIYKAFPAYQNYLDYFYSKNEFLKNASFESQREALIYDGFPWIYTWSTNSFNKDIEIFETIHNNEWLQKAWDKGEKTYSNWQIEIIIKQIRKIQPDICVLYPPELFSSIIIDEIRNTVKHDLLIVGYDGMGRGKNELFNNYDLVLTCSEYISEFYKQRGRITYTLNFGFDEKILNRIRINSKPIYKAGFSGSIYPNIHDGRYELLRELTKHNNINIRSDFGTNSNYSLFSKNQLKRLLKKHDINNFFGLWRVNKANLGPVFGLKMYQFLRDSGVSLNMHGDRVTFAANVRIYEITGVGSCMLTDWKENISQIFEPDKEVVTFASAEEAHVKLNFLLENENYRRKIALAGQKRTINEYTYKIIIPKLLSYLRTMI